MDAKSFLVVGAQFGDEGKGKVVDLLVETGLSASKGEARRLIQGGGARVNDIPVGGVEQTVSISDLSREGIIKISSGKKNHALVKIPA